MKNLKSAGFSRIPGVLMLVFAVCSFPLLQSTQTVAAAEQPDQFASGETLNAAVPKKTDRPSHSFSVANNRNGTFAPGTHLYPVYPADPFHPTTALNAASFSKSEIPAAGDKRYIFRIGGRLGLLRISPANHYDRGFQLNLHGTFLGMFDREHSLDNIGWDGLYGFNLTWRGASGTALKLGINHDSSHVGDEYAERTGRLRDEYTRQEYVAGISVPLYSHLRGYAEAGWAFDLRNEALQDKWRLQTGLEFSVPDAFWNGQMGYYAAVDMTSFEESDWEPDVTVQAGLMVPVDRIRRDFRIGVEYRSGRSLIGEFSAYEETYWVWGIWIDL
ncbi:MAG: DUF1207 domain-containing protein [Desulfobacteraceae bacterium]|nr:DUF1207 domain-containing protein [Desulfobacteraceae bacterium]